MHAMAMLYVFVFVTQAKTIFTQAMGSHSCWQQQYALNLSGRGNVEAKADAACTQWQCCMCLCWSHRQRLYSRRQWELQWDLSGNVGAEVRIDGTIHHGSVTTHRSHHTPPAPFHPAVDDHDIEEEEEDEEDSDMSYLKCLQLLSQEAAGI